MVLDVNDTDNIMP